MRTRLTKEELRKLKNLAKQKNYDAIVALLDYTVEDLMDILCEAKQDHRFIQGTIYGLKEFRKDIVQEVK